MKIKINNKKVLIVMLIMLLLILTVGYAVFSEMLTISGTANAKGTFDLEFQNAEIVKNIGADKEKTTAEISVDKNTLTVNVADLSYPGSGVEFSVDIVNVGTMPAEIQAVTPNNITGSDKIKVTGLDGIKVGHPKIEVGDRCNIHFTVEWPEDVTEILDSESSISFGLQIEYTQATLEKFDGQASHTDQGLLPDYTVPTGLTAIYGNTLADIKLPVGFRFQDPLETPVGNVGTNSFKVTYISEDNKEVKDIEVLIDVTCQTLVSQIKAEDYGKSINYVATVKNTKVKNWKVLYNDKSNIYLILDGYLPVGLVPTSTGLTTSGSYQVYSKTSADVLFKGLTTESYWNEFANGIEGAIAIGAPKYDVLIKSYNEKNKTSLNTSTPTNYTISGGDTLYVPHTVVYNSVELYWLANLDSTGKRVCSVMYKNVGTSMYSYTHSGVRPVVKLPGTVKGIVGNTIEIK